MYLHKLLCIALITMLSFTILAASEDSTGVTEAGDRIMQSYILFACLIICLFLYHFMLANTFIEKLNRGDSPLQASSSTLFSYVLIAAFIMLIWASNAVNMFYLPFNQVISRSWYRIVILAIIAFVLIAIVSSKKKVAKQS